jgi:hypothetical protein
MVLLQILNSGDQHVLVFFEVPESQVARVAQQSTNRTCFMVVIDDKDTVAAGSIRPANGTTT